MTFLAYFSIEKPVDSVHGPWTTGTLVHDRPTCIAGRWSSLEPDLRLLWSSRSMAKVQGRGSGAWGTQRAAHRRSSDGERWRRLKERGGESIVDSDESREEWEQMR
jgi:hypothetical protein